ncbi:hypothetical protein [Streptomyces sp. NBC_01429]|uniref:hypothetical protein n=1 Tax=Streptomyces sp. NBC_01429 TaxID=2903862 RepID=UPI002E2BD574|nr:hypothetical protein [Streptomyces sp. NBC_01429]
MDQRPDSGTRVGAGESGAGAVRETGKERRFELSVPQVAGSALAAVAAAVLASQLGVYGTIIGAGVVSVVATCGGSVFQHLFRRTGEQIRVVTVQARPGGRQVPLPPQPPEPPVPLETPGIARADDAEAAGAPEEFGVPTTHGTRARGWKRPVLAAAVVFLVAMAGITGYELIAGQDLNGNKGTSVGYVVSGGARSTPSSTPSDSPEPGQGQSSADSTPGGAGTDATASPDAGQSTGTGQDDGTGSSAEPSTGPSGTGDTSGSGSSGTAPAPTPSGSAGSATNDTGSGSANGGATGQDSGVTGQDTGSGTSGTDGTSAH